MRELVNDVVGLLRHAAVAKGVTLEAVIDASVPSNVCGDVQRVRQVLVNIVGNAVKFTDAGHVSVSCRLEASGEIAFLVKDSGIGMTEAQMSMIFDKFVQADGTIERRFGGTGLGLAISRQLVELMSGQISVVSQISVGSCFTVVLPLPAMAPDSRSFAAPRTAELRGQVAGRRVLLAEDHDINRLVVCDLLADYQLAVDVAADGAQAVQLVRTAIEVQRPYDLILMDLQMPSMNGYEAATRIRRLDGTVPVVAVTAGVSARERARCTAAGLDDVLPKPILRIDLERCLQQWLAGGRPDPVVRSPGGDAVFDLQLLLKNFEFDERRLHGFLPQWTSSLQAEMTRLQTAVATGDAAAIGRIAHTIKAHGLYLGSLELPARASELEAAAESDGPEIGVLAARVQAVAGALLTAIDGVDWGAVLHAAAVTEPAVAAEVHR